MLEASNPVLIEVTRGARVESVHTGAVAIARPNGELLLALGDVRRPVYPRSAIKSLQCLPLIESGAADRFGFGAEEIALACASHTGTDRHTTLCRHMLDLIGLDEPALGCGAHPPMSASAARHLVEMKSRPSQLHNNCSGKHVGMLATALHMGEPVADYWEPDHPVQQRVLAVLEEMSGLSFAPDTRGTDGCSVPTWAMPLANMAQIFARLVTPSGFDPRRRVAVERILASCWTAPEMVAGPGRADTTVMKRLPSRIFMKTGAEGVYCGGLPEFGIGFALKIDDGATRASAGATISLVERLLPEARGLVDRSVIKSWRGVEIGRIRTSPTLETALRGVKI